MTKFDDIFQICIIGGAVLFFGSCIVSLNKSENRRIEEARILNEQWDAHKNDLKNQPILNQTLFNDCQKYSVRNYTNQSIMDVVIDTPLDISIPMNFKGCIFTNVIFRDQDLNKVTFEDCTFNTTKFFNLNFGSVNMFNCTFNNSEFAVCYFGEEFKYYNWTINGLGFNQNRFHEYFTTPTVETKLEQEINIEGDNTKVDINNNTVPVDSSNSLTNFIQGSSN